MQYSSFLLAAVAASVANAVSFTNSAFNGITAGQPIDLTWGNATGPVTITLKNGPSSNLNTVSTITSGQTGSSFTWNVPASLTSDTYALEISDRNGPNYSPQFELIGGSASSSSVTASTSTSASSVSSVSSSSSSLISSVSTIVSSANTTTTAESSSTTGASNSTTTRGSSTGASSTGVSQTGSRTSSSAASPTGSSAGVPNSNSGAGALASPLALVFLTFAAIFSLN